MNSPRHAFMHSTPAIRVSGLTKHYRIYDRPQDRLLQMLWRGRKQFGHDFHALDEASFEIHRGETIGIIGRNGAGKSTLLQLICGTLTPTHGRVEVNGRIAALLELGAGFNPDFTGKDNVRLNAAVLGLSPREIDACYEDIVAFADIGEFIDQPVKTYSSGMYVRLAFAVAIHVQPDILVIDEALSVGDAFFQAKCLRRLKQIIASGATLLFISHDIGAIKAMCDRVIWLDHGRIVADGPTRDIANRYTQDWVEQANRRQNLVEPVAPAMSSQPANLPLFLPVDRYTARNGSGQARLAGLHITGLHAEKRAVTVEHGARLRLALLLDIQAPCGHLVVNYHIKDKNQQHLAGGHTAAHPDLYGRAWQGGERVTVEFVIPVCWRDGVYTLTLLVSSLRDVKQYSDAVFYDWVEDVALIRVLPRETFPLSDLIELPEAEIGVSVLES